VVKSDVLARFARSTRTNELNADDVLSALYNDLGILVERAPGRYSFSHLTLQEYLTAQHFVDERAEMELVTKHTGDHWMEVTRLAAKMLPNANSFMRLLTLELDLSSRPDYSRVIAAWKMSPVCDRGVVCAVMRALFERAVRAMRELPLRYRLKAGDLYAELSGFGPPAVRHARSDKRHLRRLEQLQADERKLQYRLNVLKNLPLLLELLRSAGLRPADVGVHHLSPFVEVGWPSELAQVFVVGLPDAH
jgi:hypothetical protein